MVIAPPPPPLAVGHPPAHRADHDHRADSAARRADALLHDLMQRAPGRPLTLDTLANALKSRGFSRRRVRPGHHPAAANQEIALSAPVSSRWWAVKMRSPGGVGAVQPDVDARDVDAEDMSGNVWSRSRAARRRSQDLDVLEATRAPAGERGGFRRNAAAPVLRSPPSPVRRGAVVAAAPARSRPSG